MRVLLILFGFVLGLAVAILTFGRIDHLRRAIPDRLPVWTDAVANGSGVGSGRAAPVPLPLLTGGATLTWAWAGLDGVSPKWDVAVDGIGMTSAGVLHLSPQNRMVWFRDGQGRLSIADLTGHLPIPALGGEVRIDAAEADYRASDQRLTRLEATGQILGASFEGQLVGNGPFSLTADVGGGWRLEFQIASDALHVEGRLSGRIGGRKLSLDALITPGEQMPDAWEKQLNFLTKPDQQGRWQLKAAFPI